MQWVFFFFFLVWGHLLFAFSIVPAIVVVGLLVIFIIRLLLLPTNTFTEVNICAYIQIQFVYEYIYTCGWYFGDKLSILYLYQWLASCAVHFMADKESGIMRMHLT